MYPFPSINQFRHMCKEAGYVFPGSPKPIVTFRGTVKLHGTNAAIAFRGMKHGKVDITFQSRNNVITPENDNAGFARCMTEEVGFVNLEKLARSNFIINENQTTIIYGEWCGEGIQKGVALTQLPKMFVIFGVKQIQWNGDEFWYDILDFDFVNSLKDEEHKIYNSAQFPNWEIEIDLEKPTLKVNDMVALTEAVEAECPVGKHFGVSGIGEGIVWRCKENPTSKLWFKVKGEKHSVSKVKKLVEVDLEKVQSINEFIDRVVTEPRVLQGIDYLKEQGKELTRKSTGDFLSWFFADVMKEESDVLEASGLTKKDISSELGKKARVLFFKEIDFS